MYKGYTVRQIVLHDYEYPETIVLVDAPAGCWACQDEGKALPGHELCSVMPDNLMEGDNVIPFLDSSVGWVLEFVGDDQFVDEWLEN